MKNEKNRADDGARAQSALKESVDEEAVADLKSLYADELKDLYWAENHLLKTLPRMAEAAKSSSLRVAFENHAIQTRNHVDRLERVFVSSGLEATARKCRGMKGLTREGERLIEDHGKGSARDSGLITVGRKVEHYEMAAYGALKSLARALNLDEAAGLLQTTLDEEEDANKLLTGLSDTMLGHVSPEPAPGSQSRSKPSA